VEAKTTTGCKEEVDHLQQAIAHRQEIIHSKENEIVSLERALKELQGVNGKRPAKKKAASPPTEKEKLQKEGIPKQWGRGKMKRKIYRVIQDGKVHRFKDIIKAIEAIEGSVSASSVNHAVSRATKQKILKRVGPGAYQLANPGIRLQKSLLKDARSRIETFFRVRSPKKVSPAAARKHLLSRYPRFSEMTYSQVFWQVQKLAKDGKLTHHEEEGLYSWALKSSKKKAPPVPAKRGKVKKAPAPKANEFQTGSMKAHVYDAVKSRTLPFTIESVHKLLSSKGFSYTQVQVGNTLSKLKQIGRLRWVEDKTYANVITIPPPTS